MGLNNETEIIQDIKDGNYLLFEDIIIRYQNQLISFIYRIVNDRDEAKDLCQETFFKAYKSIKSFKGKSKFSTWLFQIAYNSSINFLKKNKKYVKVDDDILNSKAATSTDQVIEMEKTQILNIIDSIYLTLPDRHRIALHLFFKNELSYKEISIIMEIPINSVKSNIHRGKSIIKQRIKEKYGVLQLNIRR